MYTKKDISLASLDEKLYKQNKSIGQEDKAIITHFLHNKENGIAKHYKKEAFEVLDNIVKYQTISEESDNINIGELKEAALQYLLFEVENVPFPSPDDYKFKFVDLFAGVGGFRIAMQSIGGKCVYSSEWDKDAQITYIKNFGEMPFGDITSDYVKNFIPDKFDVLCAGFPCQAFSIAGHRKGFSDTRGTLFFDIEQVVDKHRPKVLFLENVKNLVAHDKGKTFKVMIEILEEKLGYVVYHKVLNSMTHANVPQNRERIFLVAFDPKQVSNHKDFKFPPRIKLTKTIHDIIDKEKQDNKYYYPDSHKYYPELSRTMTNTDTIYQWRRIYVRENKSNVCPTLTANMGTGGHNVPLIKDDFGIRKLTPKECFAFQGYPMDKYILPNIANSKLYMQAGNSVTVPLIEKISKQIIKVLKP